MNINEGSSTEILHDLYELISDKISLINQYNNQDLKIKAKYIYESLNDLLKNVKQVYELKQESALCWSLINPSKFIYQNSPTRKNILFIEDIVIKLFKLFLDKLKLLLSFREFNYKNEYNNFVSYYYEKMEYFYVNIFEMKIDSENRITVNNLRKILG